MPVAASAPMLPTLPPVRLAVFEGPLDLLLHLVRAGEMDIFDLPIATLCAQYLESLRQMEEQRLAIAGDFFVMAATLIEIKSRLLLPAPPKTDDEASDFSDSDDPRAELMRQLLEYGKFQTIAESLQNQEGERLRLFFRPPAEYAGPYIVPPRFGEMSAAELLRALERVLAQAGDAEQAITSVRRRKITLRMTMRLVLTHTEAAGPDGILLNDLLPDGSCPLLEIVLLFLALLELMRAGSIVVLQEKFCGEIRVFFVPEPERFSLTEWSAEEGLAVAG